MRINFSKIQEKESREEYNNKLLNKFTKKKDLPILIHSINNIHNKESKLKLKPEIQQKIDSLFLNESIKSCSESSDDNISCLSNKLQRVNIIDFIRGVRSLKENYIEVFQRCGQKAKDGRIKLKIYGFSSL